MLLQNGQAVKHIHHKESVEIIQPEMGKIPVSKLKSSRLLYILYETLPLVIGKSKKVSEYDQEIPQSQTADNPLAPRGRAAQPSRDTRRTN